MLKKCLPYFWFFVVYSFLGFMRVRHAFSAPGFTVSEPGDGWGTVGWIYETVKYVREAPLVHLFGDFFATDNIGGGVRSIVMSTTYWKLLYYLSSFFFSTDNIFDFLVWLGFVLNGISAIYLARSLNLGWGYSFVFSCWIAYLETFTLRASTHLSLSHYFLPLFLIARSVITARAPTQKNLIVAFLTLAVCFQANEYYCYFAVVFSLPLFLSLFVYYQTHHELSFVKLFQISTKPFFIFLGVMVLLYPFLIGKPILKHLKLVNDFPPTSHGAESFDSFSLSNPSLLAQSMIPWFRDLTYVKPEPEFSFRLGLIGCVFFVIVATFSFVLSLKKRKTSETTLIVLATTVVFLFSLKPSEYWYSAVPMTKQLFPMFRVGMRALLFVDVGMLLTIVTAMQTISAHLFSRENKLSFSVFTFFSSLVCAGIWIDLRPWNQGLTHPLVVQNLNLDKDVTRVLAEKPMGMVMELPFYCEAIDPPEKDYYSFLYRIVHDKPVMNYMWNSNYVHEIRLFAHLVNNPNQNTVSWLGQLGIRYLVLRSSDKNFDAYRSSEGARLVLSEGGKSVWEIRDAKKFDKQKFKESHLMAGSWPYEHLYTGIESSRLIEPSTPQLGKARGASVTKDQLPALLSWGPYVSFLKKQTYSVEFSVKLARRPSDDIALDTEIMGLRVSTDVEKTAAEKRLTLRDLLPVGRLHKFVLDIRLSKQGNVEFFTTIFKPVDVIGENVTYYPKN